MSEAMTNVEIEDVLSSIRRLVAEGERPVARAAVPTTATAPDKLVLTPAFRIVPEQRPAGAPSGAAPAAEAEPRRSVAATLEAALTGRADDWEADGSEVTVLGAEDWAVEWEAGSSPAAEFVSNRAPAEQGAPAAIPQSPAPQPEEGAVDPRPAEPAAAAAHADRAASRFSFVQDSPADDTPYMDEEALRDLIRDILREELQGALGERITRNVRKLVRAEIARAIAARELDDRM